MINLNRVIKSLYLILFTLVFFCSSSNVLGQTVYTYTVSSTEQNAKSYDDAMVVACLQGIINRNSAEIYLTPSYINRPLYGFLTPNDLTRTEYWLDIMTTGNRWLSNYDIANISDINDLFTLAEGKVKGVVIWDKNVPATINVATTIAGVEDAIVLSPDNANRYHNRWNLPVIIDLRGMFTGVVTGSKKNDAYRWAIDNYLKTGKCSTHQVCLYEDAFSTRDIGNDKYVVVRDWAIMNRSFVYDLSPWGDEAPYDDPNQRRGTDLATYKQMLSEIYKNAGGTEMTEIAGFFSFSKYSNVAPNESIHEPVQTEWESVYLMSPYNCYQNTVADDCYNQSFHSQAPVTTLKQSRPVLEPLKNKTYICFLMADFDSATPLYDFIPDFWDDPQRGELPVAWGINPNLIETYPDIIKYFYDTRTVNDYFTADASAAGYMNPTRILSQNLPLFVEHNKKFYDRLDMTISPMVLDFDQPSPEVKDAFSQFSSDGYATIVMDLHFNGGHSPEPQVWNEMPILNLRNNVGNIYDPEISSDVISADIPQNSTGPTFYFYRIVWTKPSLLVSTVNRLKQIRPDLDIEVVDPYNFFSLFKQFETGEILSDQLYKKLNIVDISNFPNPFVNTTTIKYNVTSTCIVSLYIYDSIGKRIETIVDSKKHKLGSYTTEWNPSSNISKGVYQIRLETFSSDGNKTSISHKLILTR